MPVDPSAEIEITAFAWVPDFAKGLVRDLRVRWALEEIGLPYRVRLLHGERPPEYYLEQPFGQVPAYRDPEVQLFESGAILIHLGLKDERLLPTAIEPRMRGIAWLISALNSVEPMFFELINIDIFNKGQAWTEERRPQVLDRIRARLALLAEALGDRDWFEGRFSIGNLMMATVLRNLRHTDLVAEQPRLAAFLERSQQRPAFQRALADQLEVFKQHQPEGAAA
ncbi:glutathione S-transferase family protein [Sphingomonas sp.]|uniref:glutathione S-transferase family protein n=1 Tax=Sphingomonas sp. TaxID=28214 RepID=UPI00185C7D2C|nr:glutathione S-transferase family protein [Sphingomonas sp.]MBA3511159.1 glutathione S-transferase family protein [Sphingomonas sp.]